MKLWAQIDPVVGAPLTPNKQTNKDFDRDGRRGGFVITETLLLV